MDPALSTIFLRLGYKDCIYDHYCATPNVSFVGGGPLPASQGSYSLAFTPTEGSTATTATATVSGIPHPQIAVRADTSGHYATGGDVVGDAYARLDYYFMIFSPGTATVPIAFSVTETVGGQAPAVSSTGQPFDSFAYACAYIAYLDSRCVFADPADAGSGGTYAFTLDYSINSNTPYLIDLTASVESFDGLAFASIDSTLSVPEAYPYPYFLILSPGIENRVPEPNSLALIAIGSIGLIVVYRHPAWAARATHLRSVMQWRKPIMEVAGHK